MTNDQIEQVRAELPRAGAPIKIARGGAEMVADIEPSERLL